MYGIRHNGMWLCLVGDEHHCWMGNPDDATKWGSMTEATLVGITVVPNSGWEVLPVR